MIHNPKKLLALADEISICGSIRIENGRLLDAHEKKMIEVALRTAAAPDTGAEQMREALRQIYRTAEMSANIMRDPRRTGAWEGSERTASAFDRLADKAKSAFDASIPSDGAIYAAISRASMTSEEKQNLDAFLDKHLADFPAPPAAGLDREAVKFFQAIADGFTGTIEHGLLVIENPDATPESIALRGVDPNLVLDVKEILAMQAAPSTKTDGER